MDIKEQWINDFIDLLEEEDPDTSNRRDISYQLATAHFDWGDNGHPERSPEEAFTLYVINREYD